MMQHIHMPVLHPGLPQPVSQNMMYLQDPIPMLGVPPPPGAPPSEIPIRAPPEAISKESKATPAEVPDESHNGREGGWFSDEDGNLKYVVFVVKRPWCSLCSVLAMCLIMTVLLGVIVAGDGSVVTNDENAYDLFHVRSQDYDSYRLAKEYVEETRDATENAGFVELRQSESLDIVYWIYEAETEGGMFTREALLDMKKADSIMLEHKDWQEYCVLEHFDDDGIKKPVSNVACKKPLSATTIFYPESWDSSLAQDVVNRLKDDTTLKLFNNMAPCIEFGKECDEAMSEVTEEQRIAALQLNDDIDSITSKWTGSGELVDKPEEVALFCAWLKLLPTKSFLVDFYFDKHFSVDNPVSMYSRTILEFGGPLKGYNRTEEDKDDQRKLIKDYVIDNLYDDMEKVSKKSASKNSNTNYFMTALIFDVILRLIFADTMKAIVSVLLVYNYLWRMLGSGFLASVGMLEIILSIPCAWFFFRGIFQVQYWTGVNALCIFIVCAIGADDIFVFMETYKLSAHMGPTVNRDLATRMSWVWRKAGKAMAITSATTCIAFLCACFAPVAPPRSFGIFACLVILFDYLLVMSLFCTAVVIYHNQFERPPACSVPFCCGCCTENCECGLQKPTPTERNLASFHDGMEVPQDRVSKFFSTRVTDFVLSVKGRVIILVVLLAWLIPATVFVSKLEPIKSAEQFLDEDHPLQHSITILNNQFPMSSQDQGLPVFFTWGLDRLDQSGVNVLVDPEYHGAPTFKEDFTFSPDCQLKISQVCNDLQYTRTDERTALLKRDERGFSVVRCVMHTFAPFAAAQNWTSGSDNTVPLEHVNEAIKAYLSAPHEGVDDIEDTLENFGWDGQRLRYVSVEVESQVLDPFSDLPEGTTNAQYEQFVELAEHLDSIVGDSCGASGVLMTDLDQKFIWANNQKIYRHSAIQSACVGVAMAFVVLLLATRSPLLAVLATLSITCTIMSVVAVMVMMGWELGTIESILISILAGFSIDYVVHLAHAYAEAVGSSAARVRQAFGTMGTPVLSGMLTSVLASIPMLTCQILFFQKFGAFLCFTILFSWVFANFGFMGLVATFGCEQAVQTTPNTDEAKETEETDSRASSHAQAVYVCDNPA